MEKYNDPRNENLPDLPKSRTELDMEMRAIRLGYMPKNMLTEALQTLAKIHKGDYKASTRTKMRAAQALADWASKQEDVQVAMMSIAAKGEDMEARRQEYAIRKEENETRKMEVAAKLESIRSGQPQVQVNVAAGAGDLDYQAAVSKIMAKSGMLEDKTNE